MRFLFVAVLALTGCATTYNATWREPVIEGASDEAAAAAGDAAWKNRADKASLTKAIDAWELAGPDSLAKLAQGHALLAEVYANEGDFDRRDSQTRLGLDVATQAVKRAAPEFAAAQAEGGMAADLIPASAVPAAYWFALHLERWSAAQGLGTRLRYKADIQAVMQRIETLDEAYDFGGPSRFRGMLEALTEGRAGGTWEASEAAFSKAQQLGGAYLGNKVTWAEMLCVQRGDRATFTRLLSEVVAADAGGEAENLVAQGRAKALLARTDSIF